jgi:alkanesulfonate monooxygenase SsuD/methylene tetrahydromethanopterin reductase-like flavin-dependent oxidoreductase (luciferase family)
MPRLVLRLDMRNPRSNVPPVELYATAIEMAVWADQRGFDTVQISEHHGSDDAYIPSPIVLAAAIASRTKHIRLRFGVIILPLHDPLRLAEDLAVLDIISNGRVTASFGAGYVLSEFEMFGVDRGERGRLIEEGVAAIKAAWTGREFVYRGRRARVTPTPVQKPRPPIWLGGSSAAAARRAARLADYFYAAEEHLYAEYRFASIELGRDPGPWRSLGAGFFVVADNPEQEWDRMSPYIAHEMVSYASLSAGGAGPNKPFSLDDMAKLRVSGAYPILRPAEAIDYLEQLGAEGELALHPLISGLPPEIGWDQLRRFEAEILPHIRP